MNEETYRIPVSWEEPTLPERARNGVVPGIIGGTILGTVPALIVGGFVDAYTHIQTGTTMVQGSITTNEGADAILLTWGCFATLAWLYGFITTKPRVTVYNSPR